MLRRGTAAGNRRRSAVSIAAAAAVSLLAACAGRPAPEVDGPRRAARAAVRTVRGAIPSKARQIEQLVAIAEVATAAENASPWWQGSVGRTQAAWFRVVHTSREAVAAVRAARETARARYAALRPEAHDEVARATAEINEAGMGRHEAAAMQRAIVGMKLGERMAAAGRYQDAVEELQRAREGAAVVHSKWRAVHARFSEAANLRLWRLWAEQTIDDSARSGEPAILVDKLRRRVLLYVGGRVHASFPAELGANGLDRKEHSGDRATPEGRYRVVQAKTAPTTRYNRALLINYPNDEDRMRFALGKRRGTIAARAVIGSLIEIHGDGGEGRDWTDGCVALTNSDMERLYARVHVGTPVTIVGTYEH